MSWLSLAGWRTAKTHSHNQLSSVQLMSSAVQHNTTNNTNSNHMNNETYYLHRSDGIYNANVSELQARKNDHIWSFAEINSI